MTDETESSQDEIDKLFRKADSAVLTDTELKNQEFEDFFRRAVEKKDSVTEQELAEFYMNNILNDNIDTTEKLRIIALYDEDYELYDKAIQAYDKASAFVDYKILTDPNYKYDSKSLPLLSEFPNEELSSEESNEIKDKILNKLENFKEQKNRYEELCNKFFRPNDYESSSPTVHDKLNRNIEQIAGLPSFVENHPSLLKKLLTDLEAEEAQLKELGRMRRENPWDTPEAQRGMKVFSGEVRIVKPESDESSLEDLLTANMNDASLRYQISLMIPNDFHKNVRAIVINSQEDPRTEGKGYYESSQEALEINKIRASMRIEEVLFHEIFEEARLTLSLDEMEGWIRALANDREAGHSGYISEYSRKASLESESLGDKEDFCDSGRLYLMDKQDLKLMAPNRYEFIVKLIASRLPKNVEEGYRNMNLGLQYEEDSARKKVLNAHNKPSKQDFEADVKKIKWNKAGTHQKNISEKAVPEGNVISINRSPFIKVV